MTIGNYLIDVYYKQHGALYTIKKSYATELNIEVIVLTLLKNIMFPDRSELFVDIWEESGTILVRASFDHNLTVTFVNIFKRGFIHPKRKYLVSWILKKIPEDEWAWRLFSETNSLRASSVDQPARWATILREDNV